MAQDIPIQIRKKSGDVSHPQKNFFTAVDKFFFVGVIAGLLGSAWLGIDLWLTRDGYLSFSSHYMSLRNLHSLIQVYLFLGLFILGFSFHAVPRIMGGGVPTPKWAPVIIALPILGVLVEYLAPNPGGGSLFIAAAYATTALFTLKLCRAASIQNTLVFGIPMTFGLSVLALGAFFDLSNPLTALFIFWLGIGPIIFATSQQFISGFLKGKKFSERLSRIHIALFATSAVFACLIALGDAWLPRGLVAPFSWSYYRVFITINLVISLSHFVFTKCYRGFLPPYTPIGITFATAFGWNIIAQLLLLEGVQNADRGLHILALGLALTLVIGTSTNIISFMSTKPVLPPRLLLTLTLLWQVVPLERCFQGILPFASEAPIIGGAIVLLVLGIWGIAMLAGITRLIKGQLLMKRMSESTP